MKKAAFYGGLFYIKEGDVFTSPSTKTNCLMRKFATKCKNNSLRFLSL
jgi:hypothetical protein